MSLGETGNLSPSVIAWSNTTTVQFGDTALTGAETLEFLATAAFYTISAKVNTVKKTNNVSVLS